MKIIKLIAASALAMAAPTYAANWAFAGFENNIGFYYDTDTMQRSGETVTLWEKWDHARDKSVQQRTTLIRARYNCSDRTYTHLHAILYFPDGTHKTLEYSTYEQQQEKMIAPDTVGDTKLKIYCGV